MSWTAPKRPVDHAEHALITAILDGQFPPGAALPAERALATQLGVTRPTLREALRRLERDGWLAIHQGKSTIVTDFWWEGGLNILAGIVRHSRRLPPDFITNLLRARLDMAPSYTRLAVENNPADVIALLAGYTDLDDSPPAFAAFDWAVQRGLTVASCNPIYALILNSFAEFYEELAVGYFALDDSRASSRAYYADLLAAARQGDSDRAEAITRTIMQTSVALWQQASGE
jgi:GntR family negative regulator for fad regulon and positive regulator of fabA